jgi:hypothetical protein
MDRQRLEGRRTGGGVCAAAGRQVLGTPDRQGFDTSSKGTPGVKLTFTVVEGEHKGRKLWFDVWLTDAAAAQARRDLAKLGIASKAQLEKPLPTDKRIRCELRVVIRTSDAGDTFNVVRGFDVVGVDDIPADPFAPAFPLPPDRPAAPDAETPMLPMPPEADEVPSVADVLPDAGSEHPCRSRSW